MARATHHHHSAIHVRPAARQPGNPYADRPLDELHHACRQRAATLFDAAPRRSREDRENLARDTAYLLLAVAPSLASGEETPGSPAREVLKGTANFVDAHWRAHESTLRSARYRTLIMASDLALGERAGTWRRDAWIDGERVYNLAMTSETGLLRVLSELAKLQSPRRMHQ